MTSDKRGKRASRADDVDVEMSISQAIGTSSSAANQSQANEGERKSCVIERLC